MPRTDGGSFTAEAPDVLGGRWIQYDGDLGWADAQEKETGMPSYTREGRINAGGQGEVWRGRAADGTEVALKFLTLSGNPAQQAEDLARFEREVRLQTSLHHPGIMPILGVHLEGPEPHFAMPIAEASLRDKLSAARTGLEVDEATAVFGEMLAAVAHAHAEGVIHRDLKPENVLFRAGRAMLSDFGLGRRLYSGSTTLTITNAAMGTFAYSAPEQFNDAHQADERADVFALGRIFYEMLCGGYAFQNIDLTRIPAQFRYIVHHATQAEPERRFQSVAEMVRELAVFENGEGDEVLLAPSEQAKRLITSIASGDWSGVPDLTRLLLQHGDDMQLYLQVVPTTPEEVLSAIALRQPDEYLSIIQNFDKYADGSHAFSFTDTLAVFLRAAFDVTTDMRVRTLVIERLLVLGYEHNRWFVRDRFSDVVRTALQEPGYGAAIAAIIRSYPRALPFIRPALEGMSLPTAIRDALR